MYIIRKKNLQKRLPTIVELDELEKEIKYDIFNELSYSFIPLCIKLKHIIHEKEVKELEKKSKH